MRVDCYMRERESPCDDGGVLMRESKRYNISATAFDDETVEAVKKAIRNAMNQFHYMIENGGSYPNADSECDSRLNELRNALAAMEDSHA